MAWRSSGTSNESMVDNLKRFGVVRTPAVERAMRAVDRRYFVPQNQLSLAHSDQPLREGHVHISAPHIYGTALEALELDEGSAQSFLNLGSGTGYLSCMVASCLGPAAVHVGVEVSPETITHFHASVARWKAGTDLAKNTPPMEMIHGNALHIQNNVGEAVTGFDRIYVGSTLERSKLRQIAALLKPGGILVGPVDDDLVKVLRVSDNHGTEERMSFTAAPMRHLPRTIRGHPPMLSNDFSVQVLSAVRFASLVESPAIPTVLPSRIWEPSLHSRYPDSFKQACREILLCAHAQAMQPPPPVPPPPRVNAAAILPRAVWWNVLSYTTRDWFEKPRDTQELLRRRLREEQAALAQAQEARQRAETRLALMERERDLYKNMALRWQARLRHATGDAASTAAVAGDDAEQEEADLLFLEAPRAGHILRTFGARMRHMNRLLLAQSDDDDDDSDEDDGDDNNGDQEDIDLDDHDLADGEDNNVDEDDDDESQQEVDMEDVNEATAAVAMEEDVMAFSGHLRRSQARTVSIGDDF